MKYFFRLRFYWLILPLLFLLILLMWTMLVPLEQILYFFSNCHGETTADQTAIRENLNQIQILMWIMVGGVAVIGAAVAWMISRRILSPIDAIRNTIHQAGQGDLDARIPVSSGREFEALSNELNRMMEHRKQDQERLERRNRTLSAICACRHVLIHETDEKRLDQAICRIFIDTGAYRMAWIGYTDENEHGTVIPAALAGYRNESRNIPLAETACSIADRSIRNRHPAIASDVLGDPLFAPLQDDAARWGYASILALPLSIEQRILGVLTLYAEKTDAFGTDEVRILSEMADDLAYGIHTIRCTEKK